MYKTRIKKIFALLPREGADSEPDSDSEEYNFPYKRVDSSVDEQEVCAPTDNFDVVLPEQIESAEISNLSNIDDSIEDSSSSSGNEPLRSAPNIIFRQQVHSPPIRKDNNEWARSDKEKAEIFAEYL